MSRSRQASRSTASRRGGSLEPERREQPAPKVDATDAIRDGARLAALRDLELLDSGPDEAIERFTRLASELLGVPVSLVSLLDSNRQYFVGQHGLEGEWAAARQTPLSHSFCQYAVAGKAPLVVDDAREHPLVRDNLAVRDLHVIAYAGMPLVLEDGNAVGAFCAIDDKPHHWSGRELGILEDLAAAVKSLLDLRQALARQGLQDRLTGLPNRDLLIAYCDQLLSHHSDDRLVAVMCGGIDHFAQINQAFGTEDADGVLKAVANQLAGSVRETDVFGRLRGDVFTLIAPGVRDEAEALGLAGRLRDALGSRPVRVRGEELTVGITVGIATGRVGDRGADLISEAANAMREAKVRRDRVHISEAGWSAKAEAQVRLRDSLRHALERGEISAAFQPIVELDGGRLRGFETLARWTNPQLGSVGPDEFIPIAELTADVIPIGERMLEEAAARVAEWRAAGHPELRATVNVSPLQLEQPNFVEVVASILERADLPGEAIGIEITEGALLETGVIQQRNLLRLRELGARIVLDDFGTGYSALSYLRRFPLDVIKLDRSFVESIADDRVSAALTQAIIAMSKGLNLEVVGEGIETEEQARLLCLLGCRYGQGYLFGKPVGGDDVVLPTPGRP